MIISVFCILIRREIAAQKKVVAQENQNTNFCEGITRVLNMKRRLFDLETY